MAYTKKPPTKAKATTPPVDPMTHEMVKATMKFLNKVNRHLKETTGLKVKVINPDTQVVKNIPTIKPGSVK